MKKLKHCFLIRPASLLTFVLFFLSAQAEVILPKVLRSRMVLQRDVPVPLWGTAEPNEKITVKFGDKTLNTQAAADGAWSVKLPATPAGGPHEIAITDSHGTITTLSEVLFGEVWVCSGQSNMQMNVGGSDGAKEAIAAADHPQIRLFTIPNHTADTPQNDTPGKWEICSPKTVPGFSAAGYFFGVELHKSLGVPIGLINTSWGGTPAESWATRESLEANPSLQSIAKRWDDVIANYNPEKAKQIHNEAIEKWKIDAEKAKADGKPAPKRPNPPDNPHKNPWRAATLYNAMISPLVRMPVAGAIWYQGESNVGRAAQYRVLFPAMIQSWRDNWHQPKMPFYFVQIAPYRYRADNGLACAELWDAQFHTLKTVPNTGMAVISDVGNVADIHPRNKIEVGRRLALWALAKTYGKNIVYSGPIYQDIKVEGNKIRVSFDSVGGGLAARDGKPLMHFAIAGDDQKFEAAVATIDGKTIVVQSDKIAKPVAVRFAWHEEAEPNLMNKEGLPASPFRSDDWKLITAGRN